MKMLWTCQVMERRPCVETIDEASAGRSSTSGSSNRRHEFPAAHDSRTKHDRAVQFQWCITQWVDGKVWNVLSRRQSGLADSNGTIELDARTLTLTHDREPVPRRVLSAAMLLVPVMFCFFAWKLLVEA